MENGKHRVGTRLPAMRCAVVLGWTLACGAVDAPAPSGPAVPPLAALYAYAFDGERLTPSFFLLTPLDERGAPRARTVRYASGGWARFRLPGGVYHVRADGGPLRAPAENVVALRAGEPHFLVLKTPGVASGRFADWRLFSPDFPYASPGAPVPAGPDADGADDPDANAVLRAWASGWTAVAFRGFPLRSAPWNLSIGGATFEARRQAEEPPWRTPVFSSFDPSEPLPPVQPPPPSDAPSPDAADLDDSPREAAPAAKADDTDGTGDAPPSTPASESAKKESMVRVLTRPPPSDGGDALPEHLTIDLPPFDAVACWRADDPDAGSFYAVFPGYAPLSFPPPAPVDGAWHTLWRAARAKEAWIVVRRPSAEHGGFMWPLAVVAGPLFDAIDPGDDENGLALWTALLDQGYPVALALGGRDADDVPAARPFEGLWVPYDRPTTGPVPSTDPAARWVRMLREGRTVATRGPFVGFALDGASSGDVLPPADVPRALHLTAHAPAGDGLERVDVLVNGEVVHRWRARNTHTTRMSVRPTLVLRRPGWLAVRATTRDGRWAMANPLYLRDASTPPPRAATARVIVRLRDPAGRPLAGTAEIWRGDRRLPPGALRVPAQAAGATVTMPPDARLRLTAPGYRTVWRAPYADGPAGAYVRTLLATPVRWRDAALDGSLYTEVARRLASTAFTVALTPDPSPPRSPSRGAAEADGF